MINSPRISTCRNILPILLLAALAGCTQQQSPQEIRQKTAQATADAKNDAKAVAQGIREGLANNKQIDLNSGTRDQLLGLPGLTGEKADRIIQNRPYRDKNDLLTRHLVSKGEYDRIADRVSASQ